MSDRTRYIAWDTDDPYVQELVDQLVTDDRQRDVADLTADYHIGISEDGPNIEITAWRCPSRVGIWRVWQSLN